MLLSDTCLLRSNEHEKTYSFIDLGGRGRDVDLERSADIAIAKPDHRDATNLKA
jgi:hypothetical protein